MHTNYVQLIGYIGNHLVARTTAKGHRCVSMRVATHYPHRTVSGEKKFATVWHDVIAWDKTATRAEESFVKGSRILVQGAIEYRVYFDTAGHTRYLTRIQAHNLINLDR